MIQWSVHKADDDDWVVLEHADTTSERIVCRCGEVEDAQAIADRHNESEPTATARRFAAAVAMQGMLAMGYCVNESGGQVSPLAVQRLVSRSVIVADALLDALKQPRG